MEKPPCRYGQDGFVLHRYLSSFEAVATGAMFRVAVTSTAYVDFAQGAVVARTIVLTFGNAAADCIVDFMSVFIRHNKIPP